MNKNQISLLEKFGGEMEYLTGFFLMLLEDKPRCYKAPTIKLIKWKV